MMKQGDSGITCVSRQKDGEEMRTFGEEVGMEVTCWKTEQTEEAWKVTQGLYLSKWRKSVCDRRKV